MNRIVSIIIFNLILISGYSAFSQDKELENKDFFGETKWEPTLSDAYKISDSPKSDTVVTPAPELSYSISPVKLNTSFELTPIKAVKIKDENIIKFYKNYVKLGFGNYTTPYAEVFVNNLRSKKYSIGAHLKHYSSAGQINNYGPSGFSDNLVNIYGEKYLPNYSIAADFNYTRNVVHFYGYNADKYNFTENDIKQRFNYFNTNLEFASRYMDKFKLHHTIKLNYYNLSDLYTSQENDVLIEGNANKYFDEYLAGIKADADFINYKNDHATINRNIVSVLPTVTIKQNEWSLTGGFKVAIESDSSSNIYHFYPHAVFSYNIIDKVLSFNATYTGGVQKNNFRTFSLENPFIDVINNYKNTNNKIDVSGELKTSFSVNTTLTVGANYKEISNMALYVYGPYNPLFHVIYDNAHCFNLHAELSHQQSEKIRFLLKGDYFKYTMEHELEAWNKPQLQLSLSTHYNIQNKIIIKGDIFAIGERYAKGYGYFHSASSYTYSEYAVRLNPFVDANLGVEYRFTKLLSFYLNFNNIGAVRYYQWYNYPSQRFNVMGGLTFSF